MPQSSAKNTAPIDTRAFLIGGVPQYGSRARNKPCTDKIDFTLAIMSKAHVVAAMILGLSCAHVSATETPLTFSGRYEYRTDQESLEILGKQVCFFPSQPTARAVPRPAGDKRLPWFCFSNFASATDALGFDLNTPAKGCGVRGTATVSVSSYVRYAGEGDGNDVALLNAVLKKSNPVSIQCSE